LVGRTTGGNNLRIFGARKIGVAVVTQEWDRIEKRMFHSNFSKDQVGFCIRVIYRHHMTPHNFCGIFKQLFKIVVV
jgi:hypothetical protein